MKNFIKIFVAILFSVNVFGQGATVNDLLTKNPKLKTFSIGGSVKATDNKEIIFDTLAKAINTYNIRYCVSKAELIAFKDSKIAYHDGSQWSLKNGNIVSNGGSFSGTEIRVNSNYYWERKTEFITPEMFGAKGDNINDDTQAFQNCINYQKFSQKNIFCKKGIYKINTSLIKAQSFQGLNIQGQEGETVFNFSGIASGLPCLKIVGGSGQLCKSEVFGITFMGNSNSIAVEISGQCGQNIKKCIFKNSKFGVQFHNEDTGSFTEYNFIDNCTFLESCLTPVKYKKTLGTTSFNGSGITNRTTIASNTSNPIVIIGDGCNVYNSVMDFQLWISQTVTIFKNENTDYLKPTFLGNITIEIFGTNIVTMATGAYPTYFSGNFSSLNDYIEYGKLIKCDFSQTLVNGNVATKNAKWSGLFNLSTGDNLLNAPLSGTTLDAYLHISAPNYDYRYKLIVENSGFALPPSIKKITNSLSFNASGYGEPQISCDVNGKLVISNINFPSTGVKCFLTLNQNNDEYFGGGQHFSGTSTNVITSGIGTKYPMSDIDKNDFNVLVIPEVKISNPYSTITANATTPIPKGGAGTIVFSGSEFFGWNGTVWKQLSN
jgi:hypothetical protein